MSQFGAEEIQGVKPNALTHPISTGIAFYRKRIHAMAQLRRFVPKQSKRNPISSLNIKPSLSAYSRNWIDSLWRQWLTNLPFNTADRPHMGPSWSFMYFNDATRLPSPKQKDPWLHLVRWNPIWTVHNRIRNGLCVEKSLQTGVLFWMFVGFTELEWQCVTYVTCSTNGHSQYLHKMISIALIISAL